MPRSCFIIALVGLGLFSALPVRAQLTVSNSATLTVSLSGSNVLLRADFDSTNGAFTLVQGARPDALTLPDCSCLISNQILDIGWVPPARTAQWTLTNWPAAPARFFRLEIEPVLRRGRALVFKDGSFDFDAMRALYGEITNGTPVVFKQPEEVWLDHLGAYDTNGLLIGSNDGRLEGFYGATRIRSVGELVFEYRDLPPLPRVYSRSNDFRVDYSGPGGLNGAGATNIVHASEVHFYYAIDDYRSRFLNDAFIDELQLPPELDRNLRVRQFRPDLMMNQTNRYDRPIFFANEFTGVLPVFYFLPWSNEYTGIFFSRRAGLAGNRILSYLFDPAAVAADYAGMAAFWILGTNTGFPPDGLWAGAGWQNNMLPPFNDGISAWVAYRYSGQSEVYKLTSYILQRMGEVSCGGTNVLCDQGSEIRNVMMFDEADLSEDAVFPFFTYPAGIDQRKGPLGSDRAALYFGAIFYDIAHEAGLGVHKADLLIWKTVSLIQRSSPVNMRYIGDRILAATRALWPDGRYTNDVADVLTSRGVPVNGVSNFRTNLPPAIGRYPETLEVSSVNGFGSAHPENHASNYDQFVWSQNSYNHPDTNADYVAYHFYKHSKYGPCDRLVLTDGTVSGGTTSPFHWIYNNDGSFYGELTGRDLGNLVLFVPGRHVRWVRSKERCPNEATGYYVEDVKPFGFRVIKATSNGFSFTTAALSETSTNKTYTLSIVDPSLATLGAASYSWTVTNHLGQAATQTGTNAQFTVAKDEPFTLHIARDRSGQIDTLTFRERGNDLDRNGGQAFVRSLVP